MPMVDVTGKAVVRRTALAAGRVRLSPGTLQRIRAGTVPKGNVLETARTAAVLAVKATPHLLPLCHPVAVTGAEVSFSEGPEAVEIRVEVIAADKTGVEMEALTAVCVAALSIYDLCKGIDDAIRIEEIRLVEKAKSPL